MRKFLGYTAVLLTLVACADGGDDAIDDDDGGDATTTTGATTTGATTSTGVTVSSSATTSSGMSAGGMGGMMGTGGAGGMGAGGMGGMMGSGGAGGMGAVTAVLLIPDSSDDAIGQYDPQTGAYLGDWLGPNQATDPWSFSTPICAAQGPNGNVYVSDQLADAVFEFQADGTYVGVFADTNDGLNNVRGIDFLGTDMLVSNNGENAINRFDAAGTKLSDFVVGLDPFDVIVASGGDVVASDIGTPDQVILYPQGNPAAPMQLLATNFPQQVKEAGNGNYLVASFSAGVVSEVTPQGTVVTSVTVSSARGVHPLGNGNWLVTSSSSSIGVSVVDPVNQTTTSVRTGSGYRFIEPATVP
ncbi:MAG: hypothetical protein AAF928_22200 [Myxococcota bacterium]